MSKIEKTFRSGEVLQASDLNDMVEGINQIESELGDFKPYVVQHYRTDGGDVYLTNADECKHILEKSYLYISLLGGIYRLEDNADGNAVYSTIGVSPSAGTLGCANLTIEKDGGFVSPKRWDLGDTSQLQTHSKYLVGAVNEVNEKVTQIGLEVGELRTYIDQTILDVINSEV